MWAEILLKNVLGSKFINSRTIDKKDLNKKFQIFEVLITETLAIIDPTTEWHSLPVSCDDGVDFIGERDELNTPYILHRPSQIVLGQVKRRTRGYNKDAFHYDVIKMIEYYNKNYAPQKTLFQIIHVFSVDRNVDPSKWLENASYPYVQYHISPINALDFFRLWRAENSFLTNILDGVCSDDEVHEVIGYLQQFQEDWSGLVAAKASMPTSSVYLGETFSCELNLTSSVDLTLSLYAVWEPEKLEYDSPVMLVYPYNMLCESISQFYISLYKNARISIKMKVQVAGEHDLGQIHLYSKSGEHITTIALGKVKVYPGIVTNFFEAPFKTVLCNLREKLSKSDGENFKSWAIVGQGGIGKTTLSKELLVTAMNYGYYVASLQCENNISDGRQLVINLILQLINQEQNTIYVYEKVFELLRDYMGVNFNKEWAKPVMEYILEKNDVSLTPVIECIVTLLLMICSKVPVFLWISDMHWASKEEITFFRVLVTTAKQNMSFFSNPLVFVFEGRDQETLIAESKSIFPYDWIHFLELKEMQTFSLSAWLPEHSREFIDMLVTPRRKRCLENERFVQLKELAFQYASGNPMHMKEYLHYLVDQDAIRVQSDGSLELIDYKAALSMRNCSIQEVIMSRLFFYRKKYSDIIDCYIILANITTNRLTLYQYINANIFSQYENYMILEKEISILSCNNTNVDFNHEFYRDTLKKQKIQNSELLEGILSFFESNIIDEHDELESLDAILLRFIQPNPCYLEITSRLLSLIERATSDQVAFKSYELLLKTPQRLWKKSISLAKIYFFMSEISIRISSWENSRKYLEKILELPQNTEEDALYHILAYKNLGNICGVSLELERSVNYCTCGLDLVKDVINKYNKDSIFYNEFLRQYEMLLNRIAVTYWFTGSCDKSVPYQQQALESAQARQDIYSISHTLYETGIRKLHTDIPGGTKNILQALELLPERSEFSEPQERFLVKVELLIARILAYSKNREENELQDILFQSKSICKSLKNETANYESALCHIVQGICHVEQGNIHDALNCFYISMDLSKIGSLETILWKSYLNLAQAYDILDAGTGSYGDQITQYSSLSLKLIKANLERNSSLPTYQALMHLPLYQTNILLGNYNHSLSVLSTQNPLFVQCGKYYFFIMD